MAKPLTPARSRVSPQGQPDRAPRAVGEYLREKAVERRAARALASKISEPKAQIAVALQANPQEGLSDPEAGSEIIDSM